MRDNDLRFQRMKDRCTGCAACCAICPVDAIHMRADWEGFLFPYVDQGTCIHCGACHYVCPLTHKGPYSEPHSCYVLRRKDLDKLPQSASGGVFAALAEWCVNQGGVVYGAAFTEDLSSVLHVRVETSEQVASLSGSKYVQSCCSKELYAQLMSDLEAGKMVVFSGTPCQVAALLAVVQGRRANLLTVDIICHSVPSPLMYVRFSELIRKKCGSKGLSSVRMRDRSKGRPFLLQAKRCDGKWLRLSGLTKLYGALWMGGVTTRKSCFSCQVKGRSGADLTIGDAWGVQRYFKPGDDGCGLSVAIVNTDRGKQALETVIHEFECNDAPFDAVLHGNPYLRQHLRTQGRDNDRKLVFDALRSPGEQWVAIARRCTSMRLTDRIWRKVRRVIGMEG